MSDPTPTQQFWSVERPQGQYYVHTLARLHEKLAPRRYLEIGCYAGQSLKLASCATIAVDPAMGRLEAGMVGSKPSLLMFQATSDRFFADHDPTALLGGPIDLAFLDGMHLYEFLLRDFMNTERHCRPNSVIVLHDCLPCDAYVARRKAADRSLLPLSRPETADWWAGDVWKTIALLQRYRPELAIAVYAAPPTGLVTVTNLDPTSTVLSRDYAEAVASMRDTGASEFLAYHAALRIDPTSFLDSDENIAERYWM